MVGIPSAILYASAWRQLMGYGVVGLIVVFCTMTGALLIARSIARPVRLLNFAAEEFGGGNFSARAPTEGKDEMSRLGMNFNAMAERLQKESAIYRAGPAQVGVRLNRLSRATHTFDHNQGTNAPSNARGTRGNEKARVY